MVRRIFFVRRRFIWIAERAFDTFLQAHGLKRERRKWRNPFAVAFVNDSSRLYVEGINWGGSARASVGSSRPAFEDYDLLDVVGVGCPGMLPSEAELKGQDEAVYALARCALECEAVATIMSGDFGLFPRLDQVREKRARDSRERLFPNSKA